MSPEESTGAADARRGSHAAPRSGMGAVLVGEEFSVGDAVGGPRGILESVLPTALFVVLFVVTRSIPIAGGAAVAVVVAAAGHGGVVARRLRATHPAGAAGSGAPDRLNGFQEGGPVWQA